MKGAVCARDIAEEKEAERFAGARLGRANVEIRSGKEVVMTVGRSAPKGEDGELVIVANQITTDIGGDVIEDGRAWRRAILAIAIRD